MSLSSLSVRRGVTTAMILLVAAGFGLFSLARLRLDLYPDLDFPLVVAITEYEGAGPREVEDLVTRPIEGAVASVEGVKKVSSESKQGVSLVTVEFNWGADLKQAEIDVRKYIDMIRRQLPTDIQDPIIFAMNPSLQPIAFLTVRGPYPEVKLREIAEEKIEPLLERVSGIAVASTEGGGKREIQIQVDPRRLAAAGVSPLQVVNALRAENVQLPGGTFDQGGWEFTIQTKGRYSSVKQIEETVVGMRQGVPLRLRDLATVHDGLKEQTRLVRNDGRAGLMLMVRKQSDANTVLAVRGLKAAIPEIERKAGRGVKLSMLFDQGEIIEKSVGNLGSTGWQAVLLTFVVLMFFLRQTRPSLIVAISVPLSVVVTFAVMDALGLTLNIISMSGLALAIGMLVDNSIVVQESIFLHAQSKPPREAAVTGAKEVAMAITASTLTTLAVFIPILFVPGIAGMMFRDMTVTVCVSLTVSLLVALSAVPLAASRLLQSAAAGKSRPPGLISRSLGRVQDLWTEGYVRLLGRVLRARKRTYALVTLITIGSLVLAGQMATQFFPKHDSGILVMQMDRPVGTSIESTEESFTRMEQIVAAEIPERKTMNMDIGTGEGFVALFSKGPHSGIMRLKLKDLKDRKRPQSEIEAHLRRAFARIPGIEATVFQPSFMGSEADIVLEIYGHDLAEAHDLGLKLKEMVKSIKGTADVKFSLEAGKPEYEVIFDRSRLAALGLNAATVSQTISTVFSGKVASVYEEGGFEYDIRVRGPKDFRRNETSLRTLPIVTPTGATVSLASIASIRPSVGPVSITRQDQQRLVKVTAAVPGKDMGSVVTALEARLAKFPWPQSFTYRVGGSAEDFKESFKWLGLALLAAILLVYMVMASQFESLLHPFILLFSVPLCFVGVVVALLATGTPISVIALIGMLILVGIVVNNAIVLVDYINQLRQEGVPLQQAVLDAGRRRLRPVLMTAGTTIIGMLPLALELGEGAEGWSPLARTVIGGLTASTLLTLVVIPSLYVSLETYRAKRRERRAAKRAAKATV